MLRLFLLFSDYRATVCVPEWIMHCNSKHIFPEKELRGRSPNSYIHVSVCDFVFPRSACMFCCRKIGGPIEGIYESLTDT
jgi:hypothetical protein